MTLKSINPATGELIRDYEAVTDEAAAQLVDAAHEAFLGWRETSFEVRAAALRRAAALLRGRSGRAGQADEPRDGQTA